MGIKRKHVQGCSCCETAACFSYDDEFNDNSIGSWWTQASGAWTEMSAAIIRTSSSNAQLVYTDPVTAFTDKFAEQTSIGMDQQGRLIFSWVDSSNYWVAEGSIATLTALTYRATIKIIEIVSGTPTTHVTSTKDFFSAFTPVPIIHVCYRDGDVRAYTANSAIAGPDTAFAEHTVSPPAGSFGIGTGDQTGWTTPTQFNYWHLDVDTRAGYDSACTDCPDAADTGCYTEACCGRTLPGEGGNELPSTFNFEVLDYDCDCLDNISCSESVACINGIATLTLTYNGGSSSEWEGTGDVFCDCDQEALNPGCQSCETCELSRETFQLQCNGTGSCTDFTMHNIGTVGCSPSYVSARAGGSCDPFDMTFDVPIYGCNCSPPGQGCYTSGGEELCDAGGVCNCTLTVRVYES